MYIRTYVYVYIQYHTCAQLYTHRGTSNKRRRRVGHSRRQRRGRKTKTTTTNNNNDVMNEDHVINQCPESTNTSNHGDGHRSNPPPAVFTPAKEIINEGL